MTGTPVQLVERYLFELYNDRRIDLVHQICGEPMLRHAASSVTALSREHQFAPDNDVVIDWKSVATLRNVTQALSIG